MHDSLFKVRDATNDDPWGPSATQMAEVSSFTFTYEQFPEAMGMLWKRMLQDNRQGKTTCVVTTWKLSKTRVMPIRNHVFFDFFRANWRRTYKSLLLLDYLLKNGSERVVTSAREHVYDLRTLENYSFVDENGKDQGINIRHKVWTCQNFQVSSPDSLQILPDLATKSLNLVILHSRSPI